MSLQKKCLTASAVTHGLLLVLFFVGSAFLPQKPKIDPSEFEIFTLPSDFELVAQDNVFSGGSRDAAGGPQPQPQPQKKQEPPPPPPETPKPEPQKAETVIKPPEPKPEPVKKEVVKKEPDPEAFDPSKLATKSVKLEPKKPDPISFKDIKKEIRKVTVPADSKAANNSSKATETKMAAANADALADIRKSLEGKLGSSSGPSGGRANVDDILGPGGARTASYSIYLAGIYRDAWIAPTKSSARRAVRVRVTISKDGTVLSREVLDKSGDRDFVRAAETTVNRVKRFDRPPPTNEPSVTYTLEFIPPN